MIADTYPDLSSNSNIGKCYSSRSGKYQNLRSTEETGRDTSAEVTFFTGSARRTRHTGLVCAPQASEPASGIADDVSSIMAVGISIDSFPGLIILRLYLLLARSAGPHLNKTQGIGSNATEIKPKVLRAQPPVRLVNTRNHISIRS